MVDYVFDVKKEVNNTVKYLKWYADTYLKSCSNKYVIGMSGGKDSLVACKLATMAVGKDKVVGLILPNGIQKDLDDAIECCNACGIKYYIVNIGKIYEDLEFALDVETGTTRNRVSETNDPACIRTLAILAMTRRIGGVMLNTCNRNEDVLGYSTFGGDSFGAVGPLCRYTVTEILMIGDYLELAYHLVHKLPSDGMCGTTDEINLANLLNIPGFTYERHSCLIRGQEHGFTPDEVDRLIAHYNKNKFKIEIIQVKHHDVGLYDYFDNIENPELLAINKLNELMNIKTTVVE